MTNGVAEMACQAFLATGTPPVDENGRPSRRMCHETSRFTKISFCLL